MLEGIGSVWEAKRMLSRSNMMLLENEIIHTLTSLRIRGFLPSKPHSGGLLKLVEGFKAQPCILKRSGNKTKIWKATCDYIVDATRMLGKNWTRKIFMSTSSRIDEGADKS